LIQSADHSEQLGLKIITHFPSLSVLLKAALEQDSKKGSIAHKLLKVELALCLGLIFAQSPECRRHVHQELKAFPLWMSTLRAALLKHLSFAELEYFADVVLVDSTGVNLVQNINTSDLSTKQAIQNLFNKQERRAQEDFENEIPDRSKTSKALPETRTETALGKIKSFVLSFAIHLTLSPKESDQTPVNGEEGKPAFVEEHEEESGGMNGIVSQLKDVSFSEKANQIQANKPHRPSKPSDNVSGADDSTRSEKQLSIEEKLRQKQEEIRELERMLKQESSESSDDKSRQKRAQQLLQGTKSPESLFDDDISDISSFDEPIERPSENRPQFPDRFDDAHPIGSQHYIKEDNTESQTEHTFFGNYGTTFDQQLIKSTPRDVRTLPKPTPLPQRPVSAAPTTPSSGHNSSQQGMAIATAHKKKLMNQMSLQTRSFRNALSICKRYGQWYVDPNVRKRKEFNVKTTNQAIQNHSPPKKNPMQQLLKNYVPTGDGLVMRKSTSTAATPDTASPQKLQKSWTDEDAKEADLFEIEIPFDDFRVEVMEQVLAKMKKHHKLIKKQFITCPQGINAKGRRTFLLDMNMNIMPRMCQSVQELIRLVKENGEDRIKMPIYLWKGKDRPDKSIANYNILEIIEYIKMYLANSADNNQQYIAENEYAEHVEEMLQEDEEELRERQEEIAKREMQTLQDTTNAAVSSPLTPMTNVVTWANVHGSPRESPSPEKQSPEKRVKRMGDMKRTPKKNAEKVEVTELVRTPPQ
jgi:hypothetical protein